MSKRVIVITGASGGIAEQVIRQLPKTDQLLLLGRDKATLERLYTGLTNKVCYGIDVTDDQAVEELVAHLYDRYGKVDVVINNAGYATYKMFDQFSMAEIRAMFDVNAFASMNLCRLIGSKMKDAKSGHIINVVSMSGHIASVKSSIYSATKFAMIGYSDTLRLELAPYGVSVTTVNPGPVATKFFDQADPTGEYLESVKAFTLSAEYVARKIIAVMGKNKRELNMPFALNLAHKVYTLFPNAADYLARTVFNLKK